MPQVKFLPLGIHVEAKSGESLLDTALNQDVPLAHACGGFCSCTTCEVIVKEGAENLSPMEEDEAERLESVGKKIEGHRLGCQARVIGGPITVEMVNED